MYTPNKPAIPLLNMGMHTHDVLSTLTQSLLYSQVVSRIGRQTRAQLLLLLRSGVCPVAPTRTGSGW